MINKIISVINREELAQLLFQYKDKVSYNSDQVTINVNINEFKSYVTNLLELLISGDKTEKIKLDGLNKTLNISPLQVVQDINLCYWVYIGSVSSQFVDCYSGFPTSTHLDTSSWVKFSLNKFAALSPESVNQSIIEISTAMSIALS